MLDHQDKQNIVVAIAVAILIGVSLWLMHAWSQHNKLEDCYLSGRRHCQPVAVDQ
jgi:hypothetical protein